MATTGFIKTIAGNGQCCFSGITGSPTETAIESNFAMAVTPGGNVYWAVQRYVLLWSNGSLSIVAGIGGTAYTGDGGPATLAPLLSIDGLALDSTGNLFVSEASCNCVRESLPIRELYKPWLGPEAAGRATTGFWRPKRRR